MAVTQPVWLIPIIFLILVECNISICVPLREQSSSAFYFKSIYLTAWMQVSVLRMSSGERIHLKQRKRSPWSRTRSLWDSDVTILLNEGTDATQWQSAAGVKCDTMDHCVHMVQARYLFLRFGSTPMTLRNAVFCLSVLIPQLGNLHNYNSKNTEKNHIKDL